MWLGRWFIPRRKENVLYFLLLLALLTGVIFYHRMESVYLPSGHKALRPTRWPWSPPVVDPKAPGENGAGVVLTGEDKKQGALDMEKWFMNVKARCETPICQNYGYVQNGICHCPKEFAGLFCEQPACEQKYPANFSENGRTFIIVLETSYNMGATIFQMKRNLKKALDGLKNDPTTSEWFSKYILYPFDSTFNQQYWYAPATSSNSDDIVAALNNITTMSCPGPSGCSLECPRPILATLKKVLAMPNVVNSSSVILVVTRSSPEDFASIDSIIPTLIESKAQINFVLPAITSPCGEGWSTPASKALYSISSYSDGNVFTMSPADFAGGFLQRYLPSLHRSATLREANAINCSYEEILLQVEHRVKELTIELFHPITNPPAQLTLTSPEGDSIALPPNLIASDTNYLGVIRVNDTAALKTGTYHMTTTGAGGAFCSMKIRGRTKLKIYPAYVRTSEDKYGGAMSDNATMNPILDNNNTIVVHADGLDGGSLTYVQAVAVGVGLEYSSVLLLRDNTRCSYEYYAPIPFRCSDKHYIITVHGKDALGATIRRDYSTKCV